MFIPAFTLAWMAGSSAPEEPLPPCWPLTHEYGQLWLQESAEHCL